MHRGCLALRNPTLRPAREQKSPGQVQLGRGRQGLQVGRHCSLAWRFRADPRPWPQRCPGWSTAIGDVPGGTLYNYPTFSAVAHLEAPATGSATQAPLGPTLPESDPRESIVLDRVPDRPADRVADRLAVVRESRQASNGSALQGRYPRHP